MTLPAYDSYRESGVEWLGQVPSHWDVSPIKVHFSVVGGATPKSDQERYWDEGIPWVTPADLSRLEGVSIQSSIRTISQEGLDSCAASLLPIDSVILSTRAPIGSIGIAAVPLATNQGCKGLVAKGSALPQFLVHVLSVATEQLNIRGKGTTFLELSGDELSRFKMPVPPADEQAAIAAFLDREIDKINAMLAVCGGAAPKNFGRSFASLLLERRNALILAAVTGKIDVRGRGPARSAVDQATARRLVGAPILELVASKPDAGRVKVQKLLYLAEAHAGVHEIGGRYQRIAAGPFDGDLIQDVETALDRAGHVVTSQPGGKGAQVFYRLIGRRERFRADLGAMLGDRRAVFDKLLKDVGPLDKTGAEAVATLYAVWNDMLLDGLTPTDDAVIDGVLNDWDAEKKDKFTRPDLHVWLGWMRRHDLTPRGDGPRTQAGRLL